MSDLLRRGAAAALTLAAVGLLPHLLWNAAHDWVSVRHLFGHAGNGGQPAG